MNYQIYEFDWDNMSLTNIVAHTYKNPEHKVLSEVDEETLECKYKKSNKPECTLVKDQGVYIMSGSSKVLQRKGAKKGHREVAYAIGHDPNKQEFDDWWVGGDDYGQNFPVEWVKVAIARRRNLIMKLSETHIEFELANNKGKYIISPTHTQQGE